jgi:uncharacterized integral membrane protein
MDQSLDSQNEQQNAKKRKKEKKIQIKSVKKIKYAGIQFYNLLGAVFYIVMLIFVVLFFVLNAEYKSSVYLIYTTYKNISVSTIILISFLCGNIFMLLIAMRQIRKRQKKLKMLQKQENAKEEAKIEKILN